MIVYLGHEPKDWLAAEVLRFSLEKYVKEPLEIKDLNDCTLDIPWSEKPGSPFYRWFIPYFEKYLGKAVFLEPSMIAIEPMEAIFPADSEEARALALPIEQPADTGGYHAAMLCLNLQRLKSWDPYLWISKLREDKSLYQKTMFSLPDGLNHAEMAPLPEGTILRDKPGAKFLHYADSSMKPWQNSNHPHKSYFIKLLKEAVDSKVIPLEPILLEIQAGHVYPGILQDALES